MPWLAPKRQPKNHWEQPEKIIHQTWIPIDFHALFLGRSSRLFWNASPNIGSAPKP
jgi:hypothetical protein